MVIKIYCWFLLLELFKKTKVSSHFQNKVSLFFQNMSGSVTTQPVIAFEGNLNAIVLEVSF